MNVMTTPMSVGRSPISPTMRPAPRAPSAAIVRLAERLVAFDPAEKLIGRECLPVAHLVRVLDASGESLEGQRNEQERITDGGCRGDGYEKPGDRVRHAREDDRPPGSEPGAYPGRGDAPARLAIPKAASSSPYVKAVNPRDRRAKRERTVIAAPLAMNQTCVEAASGPSVRWRYVRSQAVADLGAEVAGAGVRPGLVHPDARVECCVYEVADRVNGNRHRGSQQPDEPAADCRSEGLRGGVCLIEPRVGRNQFRPGHQAGKQRLGRGEPENGERAEQQQGDDQ